VKRKKFGLADLFGIDFAGRIEVRMQNAYLRLEHRAARGHSLLKGLEEDAPRTIHGCRASKSSREKSSCLRRSH